MFGLCLSLCLLHDQVGQVLIHVSRKEKKLCRSLERLSATGEAASLPSTSASDPERAEDAARRARMAAEAADGLPFRLVRTESLGLEHLVC